MSAPFEISHEWEEPDDLHAFLIKLREQRPDADVRRIRYAYYLAEQAHAGQLRRSGVPYITHPLSVAGILMELRMDDDTIIAGLLHDLIEDTAITADKINEIFGPAVTSMVEAVTKLSFKGPAEQSPRERAIAETTRMAESLRKMLLAVARDYRVMVIKLADRLHNMQTLEALPPEKRVRIANETLDIYAPLAARLGIWQIKWQLEDLAFKNLHPDEYKRVEELVKRSRDERQEDLNQAILMIKERFNDRGLKFMEVKGRAKHLYSIFNKMVKQGLQFEDIMDLIAVRIVVEGFADCYLALGYVHELFMPIEGLFSDYINKPKPNGYQSLHTKVVGPHGDPLEVQIRTRQMHEIAEFGVAAHWTYKEGSGASEAAHLGRLREQLFNWSSDASSSSDYLRSLSTDLFSEQVFVFTPKGDVIDLPAGSTSVDFAFRVHTQLGLTLVGAKVNGAIVPLSTTLQNGDVVELITRSNGTPSLDWLEFIKSAHARSKLRNYFRRVNKDVDSQRGKEAVDRELKAQGLEAKAYLGEDKLDAIAELIEGCDDGQDVLAKVGTGHLSVQSVVAKLRGTVQEQPSVDTIHVSKTREGRITLVGGMDNVMVHRAKCCLPIPGDEVVGYVTRGRGIIIHRKVCPNILNTMTHEPDRLLPYEWPGDGSLYSVVLKIVTLNRQGLLMDISTIFGESKTNVSRANIKTLPNQTAEIEVTIDVTDTKHLQVLMNKISNFSDVLSIFRMYGRSAGR